jgi:hypothetical protein
MSLFGITPALLLYGVTLCLALFFAMYQWVYFKELSKAKRVIGFSAPLYLRRLMKTTLILLLLTAVVSGWFFLMELLA